MHKFLKSIGFSGAIDRKEEVRLLNEAAVSADERNYITESGDVMIAEFSKSYGQNIGLTVCGVFDENDKFFPEYYFPYLRGNHISSREDITVERHAARDSYAGVCDDLRMGISMIFYVQNRIPYMKASIMEELPIVGTSVTLCGLALHGMILMPIVKNEMDKKVARKAGVKRHQLLMKARRGDENAMEILSMDEMEMYDTISRMIRSEDVFTLVDTSFMPYGVECDQYSVVAEIVACRTTKNTVTDETVHILQLLCNDIPISVCINAADLTGEPEPGRRFKGSIWLQGRINMPEGKQI